MALSLPNPREWGINGLLPPGIHSFNKYVLSTCCVPSPAVGLAIYSSKTDKSLSGWRLRDGDVGSNQCGKRHTVSKGP